MPDFEQRLRATIGWNTRLLLGEVVFVEWNPPADRPLLAPVLAREFSQLRAYVVNREIHTAISQSSRLALLEYHAKNVGIRRARSSLIAATNGDVAFGPDTIVRLRAWQAGESVAWTAQRVDIPWKDSRQKRVGLWDCLRYRRIIPHHELGTGDFLLAHRSLWERARGYDESLVHHRMGCDTRGAAQLRASGASLQRIGIVLHLAHGTSCTEEIRPHHGESAPGDGLPYENGPDWGLGQAQEKPLEERVWLLE